MKEKKVIVDVFFGDKTMNQFMHAADVFEPGKQLATYKSYTITGTPDMNKLCMNLKDALEQSGGNVVFVGINSVNGRRVKNPKEFIKPETQSISNGIKWSLFKDCLEILGYKVTTTEYMTVTSVKS